MVEEGSLVTAGTSIITVDSIDDVCIRCSANKYDIMNIEEGQKVNVSILNKDFTGEVTRKEMIAGSDATSAGVGVDVTLDDTDGIILGLDVKARVNTASLSEVISVPKEAVVSEDDGDYVFISKDKKAIKTSVETGIKNDDQIEIVSGLKEGDVLVWCNEKELKNGEDVRY